MVRDRDPFGQVLDILRVQVRDGARPPGAPLIVTDIAKSLRLSPTPVREALCHLAGEGLVDVHRGRGFSVHPLEGDDLSDLYRLQTLILDTALAGVAARDPATAPMAHAPRLSSAPAADLRWRTERVFDRIVLASGNRAFLHAMGQIGDRLAIARLVEDDVLTGVAEEVDGLDALASSGDRAGLHQAIDAYHRRRLSAVRPLAAAVRERFRTKA